jgi:hypothetical protein
MQEITGISITIKNLDNFHQDGGDVDEIRKAYNRIQSEEASSAPAKVKWQSKADAA